MKTVTFEVRIRISSSEDEAKAVLEARYKLGNVKDVLTVVQIGAVDDPRYRQEIQAL